MTINKVNFFANKMAFLAESGQMLVLGTLFGQRSQGKCQCCGGVYMVIRVCHDIHGIIKYNQISSNMIIMKVMNEADAVNLTFGLTLQQIIDVVRPSLLLLSLS